MQAWQQIHDPLGKLWLSSLVAAIPIIFFFVALASAGYDFLHGLWPIARIIVTAVFLYRVAVRTGQTLGRIRYKALEPAPGRYVSMRDSGVCQAARDERGQRPRDPGQRGMGLRRAQLAAPTGPLRWQRGANVW
jgi:hypothetical protein